MLWLVRFWVQCPSKDAISSLVQQTSTAQQSFKVLIMRHRFGRTTFTINVPASFSHTPQATLFKIAHEYEGKNRNTRQTISTSNKKSTKNMIPACMQGKSSSNEQNLFGRVIPHLIKLTLLGNLPHQLMLEINHNSRITLYFCLEP